jgi:RNA polymerase sigma-70 factor (ECF subfamily)
MYLVSTAKTMLADHWRRRLGVQVTTIDENLVVAEAQGPLQDPLPRIRRVLAKLPPNYRRVLELRFLERCSVGETAAKMGISAGNARVVQYRALQRAAELGQEVGA